MGKSTNRRLDSFKSGSSPETNGVGGTKPVKQLTLGKINFTDKLLPECVKVIFCFGLGFIQGIRRKGVLFVKKRSLIGGILSRRV